MSAAPVGARPRPSYAHLGMDAMRGFLLNLGYLLALAVVVTAPAATTALVAAARRWRRDGEAPTTRAFLGDVRGRLGADLPLGLAVLGIGAVLAADLLIIGRMGDERRLVLTLWIVCTAAVALVAVSLPVVATEAARDVRPGGMVGTVRRAAARSARRPFAAFVTAAVLCGALALATVSPLSLTLTPIVVAALGERLLGEP